MGFIDKFNVFKKKGDLSFLPKSDPITNSAPPNLSTPGMPDTKTDPLASTSFSPKGYDPVNPIDPLTNPTSHTPSTPLDDPRMKMPLGESMRQSTQQMHPSFDQSQTSHQHPHHQNDNPLKKDIELISSKLDYLKASLDSINQRLANIEHTSRNEQQNQGW